MKKRILLLLLINSSIGLISQTKIFPEKEIYYGNNNHTNRDYLKTSIVDNENNIYLIGTTENDDTFNDLKIIKLDSQLNLIWEIEKSFDLGISFDLILDAKIDTQNNLIVEASSGYNSTNQTFIILKYNINGDLIWEKSLADLNNLESHLNHSYRSELDSYNNLHVFYQLKDEHTFYQATITTNGDLTNKQLISDILISDDNLIKAHKVNIKDGDLHILTQESSQSNLSNKYNLHNISNGIIQSIPLSIDNQTEDFIKQTFAEYYTILKRNNIDDLALVSPNYTSYKDFSILNFSTDGSINYTIFPDETHDRYPLDFSFDENNNLIIISNSKISNSDDELKITLQKYNRYGELIFEKTAPHSGNIAKIIDSKILVHTYNNQILNFDFSLNLVDSGQLNSISTNSFSTVDILNIEDDYYLTGRTNDVNYSNSSFLSEIDFIIQKTNKTNSNKLYRYSGKGTSHVLELRNVVVEPDCYKLSLTEKLGPETNTKFTSLAPKQQRFLTLSKNDLSIIDDQIVPLSEYLTITYYPKNLSTEFYSDDNSIYEYKLNESKTNLSLYKDGLLLWDRDLNLYIDENGDPITPDNETIIDYKINSKGDFYILTYIYGQQKSKIYQYSLNNELKTINFDRPTFVFHPFSNGWLFTLDEIGTVIIFSRRMTEINREESHSYMYPNIGEASFYIEEKFNQIIFNKHKDNRVSIFNQYGELQNTYYHIEANLDNSSLQYDNDNIILLEDKGASIYLNPDYAWRKAVIKKININKTSDFIDFSNDDDDDDGIKNGIDECKNTVLGKVVNEYGCSPEQTLSLDEFNQLDNSIIIYPNPTNSNIKFKNLNTQTNIKQILIYDQMGRIIDQINTTNNSSEIRLSDNSSGIYYLKFHLVNNKNIIKRVIKN